MKTAGRSVLLVMRRGRVLLVAALLSACVGGQTGGEEAAPPVLPVPRASRDACQSETTPTVLASVDETTPAGFSAASVLRHAEGTFNEPLDFDELPADVGGWDASPPLAIEPGGDEALEVEIKYVDGELRYFAGVDEWCARVEIDVQVTLRTASGALDESVDGVLVASSASGARLWLQFHTAAVEPAGQTAHEDLPVVPVHRLAGDLSVSATNDDGRHRLAFIELVFTFSELGFNGYADAWLYGVDDGSLRLASLLATIGETCDGGWGYPLGPEQPVPDEVAPSAREVIALLEEMRVDAVRDDASRLPLSLDLEYAADSACGRPGDDTPLTFEAELSIAANLGDASIDGRWPVEIRVRSATDGALTNIHMTFVQPGDVSIDSSELESLQNDWGVTGLQLDGYDQVLITFDLSIQPGTDLPGIEGELFIRGYASPEDRSMPISVEDGDVLGHLSFEASPSP